MARRLVPPAALVLATAAVVGALSGCEIPDATAAQQPSGGTVPGIPANYLRLYQAAAPTCPGLHWSVLAAIGKVESDHGRSKLKGVRSGANSAGAMGPMQFLRRTWNGVRARHPEVGPNVYDPAHAIPGAAHLLCDSGVRAGNLDKAIFAYNPSTSYVRKVKKQAKAYAAGGA